MYPDYVGITWSIADKNKKTIDFSLIVWFYLFNTDFKLIREYIPITKWFWSQNLKGIEYLYLSNCSSSFFSIAEI